MQQQGASQARPESRTSTTGQPPPYPASANVPPDTSFPPRPQTSPPASATSNSSSYATGVPLHRTHAFDDLSEAESFPEQYDSTSNARATNGHFTFTFLGILSFHPFNSFFF